MTRLPLKVCGVTREEDARLCAAIGARYVGFIFASKSPRFIPPERAARLDAGGALRVGVFVGAPPEEICRAAKQARLDYVQLHGGEDAAVCRAVGPERVIKVLWPDASPGSADALAALRTECERYAPVCAMFLLDAGQSGGGSGRSLRFASFGDFAPPRPWLLAGGLGPHNLAEAARSCAPHAFDCNSGLEEAPGRKSPEKARAVAAILRGLAAPARAC